LEGVMGTVVGWARDYISFQYKAQLTFPPGFSTPRLFLCLLGFGEARIPEARFPKRILLEDAVNRDDP